MSRSLVRPRVIKSLMPLLSIQIEAKRLRAEALEGKVSGAGHHQQGQGIAPGLQQQGNSGHQYGQQQSQGGAGINDPSRTVGANY